MRVDIMSKQHLIFMPENGKTHFKFTTELQIQDQQHDESSCETCKARVKQCTVNIHSNHVQNQILIKQRECAKLWNETLDQVMKGKIIPDRIRHDSSMSDVICLDTDIEDNDIEVVDSPLQLPLLSPINHSRAQMHTPSKTPNTVTPIKCGSVLSHQFNNDLSLNVSGQITVTILPQSAKKPILSHVRNMLIYSKKSLSEDHVFWVNKFKKSVQAEKRLMQRIKGKIRKAKNYANFDLAATLESELQAKEEEFAMKHIQRIQVTDNLSTHQPLNEEVREAIYNPIKSAELFHVRSSSQQNSALTTLKQYKENLLVLEEMKNKFAPLVANELYYKEQLYKKVYLAPKIIDTSSRTSFDDSLETSSSSLGSSVIASFENFPKTSEMRRKKKLSLSQKRKKQKSLILLKKMDKILRSTDVGKIIKPTKMNSNTQSEPTMNESINLYEHNRTTETPVSSHASPRPNHIQSSNGKLSETTPVKFPSASKFPPHRPRTNNYKTPETTPVRPVSATKFQPYRSLLGFPSVDS